MDEIGGQVDLLKSSGEAIAGYLDFLIGFLRSPFEVLNGEAPEGTARVSAKLVIHCGLGVGAVYIVLLGGDALGMAPDGASAFDRMAVVGKSEMPVLTILAGILLASAWHACWLLASVTFGRVVADLKFQGRLPNTLNATLGLLAVYLPLATVLVVGVRVADAHWKVHWVAPLLAIVAFDLLLLAQAIAAFAAVHRQSVTRTAAQLFFANVFIAGGLLLAQRGAT